MQSKSLAVALSATLALGACQYSPDIAERTVAYNRAVATSTNNLFLLNALRASERQPTYFTRNTADTAQSTINPSLSVTSPSGSTPTLTTAITHNLNPVTANTTGFGTVVTATRAVTRAALGLTSGLTAAEQNQLALSNQDDQQSMNGLMSPVSLQQISNYYNEGYNPQQLLLLYFLSLSIPRSALHRLPAAAAESCAAEWKAMETWLSTSKQPNLYCQYLFGDQRDPQPRPLSAIAAKSITSPANTTAIWEYSLARDMPLHPRCFDLSQFSDIDPSAILEKYQVRPAGREAGSTDQAIELLNDPAIDPFEPEQGHPDRRAPLSIRSFRCFNEVLVVLLALDLRPAAGGSKLQYVLPEAEALGNPRYFADLTQQNLEVAPRTGPNGKTEIGVCKKGELSLELEADGFVKALFELPDVAPSGDGTASGNERQPQPLGFKLSDAPNSIRLSGDQGDAARKHDCAAAVADAEQAGQPTAKSSLVISYAPRSLANMVYYLGQIIRRQYGLGSENNTEAVKFVTWNDPQRYGPLSTHQVELFRVRSGIPPIDAVASASEGGRFYFIPGLCDAVPSCSKEYPEHYSALVLDMLNEIWDLNKTQATPPVVPTVTLIAP